MEKHKETKEATSAAGQKEPQQQQQLNEKDVLTKQLNDYKESLQRLQAEFENYKKRLEKEKAQFGQFAAAETIKDLLPVLDSFELALKSVNSNCQNSGPSAADAKLIKGLEMIYAQFYSALEAQGLRQIKAVGERFDPYKHEVLMQEETPDSNRDGVVVEEFQKGYTIGDVVLRYSKVKVLKFVAKEKSEEKARS